MRISRAAPLLLTTPDLIPHLLVMPLSCHSFQVPETFVVTTEDGQSTQLTASPTNAPTTAPTASHIAAATSSPTATATPSPTASSTTSLTKQTPKPTQASTSNITLADDDGNIFDALQSEDFDYKSLEIALAAGERVAKRQGGKERSSAISFSVDTSIRSALLRSNVTKTLFATDFACNRFPSPVRVHDKDLHSLQGEQEEG